MSDEAKEIEQIENALCGCDVMRGWTCGVHELAALARRLLEERDEARRAGVGALHDLDSAQEHIASLEQQVASYEGMDRAVTHYQEEVRRLERELRENDKLLMDMRLPRDIVED